MFTIIFDQEQFFQRLQQMYMELRKNIFSEQNPGSPECEIQDPGFHFLTKSSTKPTRLGEQYPGAAMFADQQTEIRGIFW